ncbi:C-type lectin fold [Pseudocohnilembus persalinus]|uniref:C-type lectin fold n=1 Tax=Pseudocohnilembus persalinus TaxID=266149 RepID=A0A0V0QKH1_PSEPJ|nr:C-type lectin fold [Pseudocohnilembus persalinus]|eukprot:KRX02689.1 C-type lectin fold [Pseudocohnilembus persalinus]
MSQLEETFHSLSPLNLQTANNQDLKAYFHNSYALYETLFSSISQEAFLINPDPLRRPILWYLGHTAALYINKMIDARLLTNLNEEFEKIFKTGVDPIHPEELDNDVYREKLPQVQEVWNYRKEVYNKVIEIIENTQITLPIKDTDPIYAVILGIEHERIHLETSICLIRQMPTKYLTKPQSWKYAEYNTQSYPKNEMIYVPEQNVQYGKNEEFPTYGWDNEYGKVKVNVREFKASKFLIQNGEFLEFVNSGQYNNKQYWDEEGWAWKQKMNVQKPLFWVHDENSPNKFKYRALFDEIEMPLNWPVDVSAHEARAYCKWKGQQYRLIKEGEFNVIRGENTLPIFGKNSVEADIGGFDRNSGNNQLKYASSCPVDSERPSPLGFYDTYGNVWEWTEELFKPLPGFKTHYLYPDFSGGCFEQKHSMILGSAWSSTGLSASSFARLAFRRHFYQNCGFRLVEEIKNNDQQDIYTDKVYLNRYLHFNFATNEEFFPVKSQVFDLQKYESYPLKIANECIKYFKQLRPQINSNINENNLFENTHALDLGCGMGRTAFELAKNFTKVTGLDYAHGFIDTANELKLNGEKKYTYLKTGDIYVDAVAKIDPAIDRNKVDFIQGDAMNLPSLFGPFDLIIASNLIDRLYNPIQCLISLLPLLTYDGILIITSPYTWMETVADKEKWVGGKNGQTTFEALKQLMGELCFELADEQTMTLLIKEHERKFEFIMPHMTVWKKKPFSQEFATSIFKNSQKY